MFGLTLDRDQAGRVTGVHREGGEEFVLFFEHKELWTKNPSETALQFMLDLAKALGNGARVRGDEGETYESVDKTFIHPDDIGRAADEPKFYWAYWVPRIIQVLILIAFALVFGRLGLRHLGWI